MFNKNEYLTEKPIKLKRFAAVIAAIWTLFVLSAMVWNYKAERTETYETAKLQARAAFENDILYRRWNAEHGGLYAPVTESTPPNYYLKAPERDIVTPQGQKLTKINPAYMTRQVHEIALKTTGVKGHITSLNPIRPQNKPDDWEAHALKVFQNGVEEVSSVEIFDGDKYMRLMRPLFTEEGCLKCHAVQGYQEGDLRGGISVSVPLKPLVAIERRGFMTFSIINCLLWLSGIAGIWIGMHFLNRQITHRLLVEKELRRHKKLQGAMELAGAVCHELNQPMQAISGYSELIMMGLEADTPTFKKNKAIKQQIDRMAKITRKLMKITRYETLAYPDATIIDIDKSGS